jgi:multidrug resistance efflux pump
MNKANEDLKVDKATVSVRRHELDLLKEGTRAEDIAAAESQLAEAEAGLKLLTVGYREEDKAAAKAAADAAQAAVRAMDEQIAELTIKAPLPSVVEALELRPGDLVAPNAPVLSLLDTSELWVRAYVPENRLNVQIGQHVAVTVDSFPGRKFAAVVTFVGRQAEFTPNNVQTPEERSKQVFRIKVSLENQAERDLLRPGMAADVWLDSQAGSTRPASEPAR